MSRSKCPKCESDLAFKGMVEGNQSTNNHHVPHYKCGACGWSNL